MLKENVIFSESESKYPYTIQLGLVLLNSGNMHSWYDLNYAVHSIRIDSEEDTYQDLVGTYHIHMPAPEDVEQDRIRLELACFKPDRLVKQLDESTHQYNVFFVDIHDNQDKYKQDRFILNTHPFSLFFKKSRMYYKRSYKKKQFNCLISKIQPATFQNLNTINTPPLSVKHFHINQGDVKPYELISSHCEFFKEEMNKETKRVVEDINSEYFLNLLESLNSRLNKEEGYNHSLIRDTDNTNKPSIKKELEAA